MTLRAFAKPCIRVPVLRASRSVPRIVDLNVGAVPPATAECLGKSDGVCVAIGFSLDHDQ
jgi:hypothetical protein